MEKVTIIGQGNVATHLCIALAGKVEELINISSRELEDCPQDSDIYIIAVSDNAIKEVAEKMPEVSGIVAHTAGSVPMELLKTAKTNRYGVFYPLQTFTKGAHLDYSSIPVFVEGSDSRVEDELFALASLFTANVHKADSAKREKLHIASVFACNFTNFLWTISDSILEKEGLGINLLIPLIEASVDKLRYMSPMRAQTGPASRNDTDVMQRHESELSGSPYLEIYNLLSTSIKNLKQT